MCNAMEEMCAEVAAKVEAEIVAKVNAEIVAIVQQTLRESGVSEDIIQLTVSQILNSHKDSDTDTVPKEQ